MDYKSLIDTLISISSICATIAIVVLFLKKIVLEYVFARNLIEPLTQDLIDEDEPALEKMKELMINTYGDKCYKNGELTMCTEFIEMFYKNEGVSPFIEDEYEDDIIFLISVKKAFILIQKIFIKITLLCFTMSLGFTIGYILLMFRK